MIEDLDRLTYSSSFNYLAKNGFKNLNNIEIENKILNPNFSDGLYSVSDGYKNKVLIDKTFKNEKEALKFLKEMTIKKEAVKTR